MEVLAAGPTTPRAPTAPTHPVGSDALARVLLWVLPIEGLVLLVFGLANPLVYSDDVFAYVGATLWLAAALANFAAWVGVKWKLNWGPIAVLVAQLAIVAAIVRLVVADRQSPQWDAQWLFLLLPTLAGTIAIIGTVFVKSRRAVRNVVEHHLGRAVAAAAVVPLLAFVQHWLDTEYIPSQTRPQVDVTAALQEIGRSGDVVHLKATITLHNRGERQADVIGSLYRITSIPMPQRRTAGMTASAIATAIDWGSTSGDSYPRESQSPSDHLLLRTDELLALRNFLPPGQRISHETIVDVETKNVEAVRLTAELAFVNNQNLGDITVCNEDIGIDDPGFDAVMETPAGADGGQRYMCVETKLRPRNLAEDLFDDSPSMLSYVILEDPENPGVEYPNLGLELKAETEAPTLPVSQRMEKIYPTIFISVSAEHPVVETPPADAETSP